MHRKLNSIVQFHFENKSIALKDRKKLKAFILFIFEKEKIQVKSLNCIFCLDNYLLKINRTFLQHNYYTDIITFNLSKENKPVEGEIYISAERVKENALLFEEYFYKELHRVIFHGVLHLCGYNDKSLKDKSIMRRKENYYLYLYHVPRNTVSP